MLSPAEVADPLGDAHFFRETFSFSPSHLNDDFDGGGLYLPAQDVLIMPQPGMLVSLPAGESHVHGVTRVERGVRLTMPFFLTFDRTKALGSAPTSRAKPQLDFGGLGVAGFADALSFEGAE